MEIGDKVFTFYKKDGVFILVEGTIAIIDYLGTFENKEERSYDIITTDNVLLKHIPESNVFYSNKELVEKVIYKEYPFLKYDKNNPWCYGNCDEVGWYFEVPIGWRPMFLEYMKQLKEILDSINYTDKFQIHQIKEKWAGLQFYHERVPDEILQKVNNLDRLYEKKSYNICIDCGREPVTHQTTGWITRVCSECAKNYKYVKEIKNEKTL